MKSLPMLFLALPQMLSMVAALTIHPRAGGPGDAQVTCDFYKQMEGEYNGGTSDACVMLVDNCVNKMNATQSSDPWSDNICVAAATCTGTTTLVVRVECTHLDKPMRSEDTPPLSPNIFSAIVGDSTCAAAPQECSMTQQNYIDFMNKSFIDVRVSEQPNITQVVDTWWRPIHSWAANAGETGDDVSYNSFDDWLHRSHSQ
ncbi:hypothetical protein PM082_021399 [Marasmius tenuissimus]|nr:hypothetical protein PM082_021399 [Marasmius tenuissimus]